MCLEARAVQVVSPWSVSRGNKRTIRSLNPLKTRSETSPGLCSFTLDASFGLIFCKNKRVVCMIDRIPFSSTIPAISIRVLDCHGDIF